MSAQDLDLTDDIAFSFATYIRTHNIFTRSSREFLPMLGSLLKKEARDTFFHIRALLLVFSFESFFTRDNCDLFFTPLMLHFRALPNVISTVFFEYLRGMPKFLMHILEAVKRNLLMSFQHCSTVDLDHPLFEAVAFFLTQLRDISSYGSATPIPSSTFWCKRFTALFPTNALDLAGHAILRQPAILTLEWKSGFFRCLSDHQKGYDEQRIFELGVRRDALVFDTVHAIEHARESEMRRRLFVTFRREDAIDDGGVSREYFHLLISQLFSPDYGMFQVINERFYWFDPNFDEDYRLYRTLGTVVALAVYNNMILPIRFPLLLYKKLLRKTIELRDFMEFDSDIVRNMTELTGMADRGEDVSSLSLTFSVGVDRFGQIVEVPLIENGGSIDVTKDNARRYVRAYVDWRAHKSVEQAYNAFANGFARLFGERVLSLFAPDELDILVSGEEVLDWTTLERNAIYSDGYSGSSPSVRLFWELFRGFSKAQKLKFLQFTTGSDRAPIGGLEKLIITIQRMGDPTKLPSSHTCFFIFGLPDYRNKEVMKRKIELALRETEGFGLI
jgi:ubiquitin-protein ligase E3 A